MSDNFNGSLNIGEVPIKISKMSLQAPKRLIFQQFHIEAYPPVAECQDDGIFPNIRLFEKTEEGVSVCCRVRIFQPVIHVEIPTDFEDRHCAPLRVTLNEKILSLVKECEEARLGADDLISKVQVVLDKGRKVAKLTTSSYRSFIEVSRVIDSCNVDVPGLGRVSIRNVSNPKDNLAAMFRKECNVVGFGWVELPEGTYTLISDLPCVARESNCQMEVIVDAKSIILHEPVCLHSNVVKFSILSFDIECLARPNTFPDPKVDPVIQISSIAIRYLESEPYVKRLFTLNTCAPIDGATASSYSDEKDMLEGWALFIQDVDPDMLIGFNAINFDIQYLLERAKVIQSVMFSESLGRLHRSETTILPATFENRVSRRQNSTVNIPGRLLLDVYLAISSEPAYNMQRYRLQDVSLDILGIGKTGIHHSEIPALQLGDDESRKTLGEYCLQDSLLPIKILQKTGLIDKYINRTRQSKLQFNELVRSGHNVTLNFIHTSSSLKSDKVQAATNPRPNNKRRLGMTPRRPFRDTSITEPNVIAKPLVKISPFKSPRQASVQAKTEFQPPAGPLVRKRLGMGRRK